MKQELEQAIAAAVMDLFGVTAELELTRPDEQFGDYATNVALQLSKQLGKNPREIAEALAAKLRETASETVADLSVAGPGFLNITLTSFALTQSIGKTLERVSDGKRVLLEYSCPNAFKELHTGHLYQTIVGDVIGRLLTATGAKVYRANFGGDVGLHVAKCLYGIVQTLGGEMPEKLQEISENERPQWISRTYVLGAKAYEEDASAKEQITTFNKAVYGFHTDDDHTSKLAQIYWTCREWSYGYFKSFYNKIEVAPFDKYYPESSTIARGLEVVHEHMGTVFTESEGAVVYATEEAGLHTRVYITSKGLPTYEAKDTGVIYNEVDDFPYDKRILLTGNDQIAYMKVIFAALGEIDAELAAKQTHLTNGTVRFGSGQKMSSRLGNVTRAVEVVEAVDVAVSTNYPEADHTQVSLAAIKYSFLKHRLGGDIAFDIEESVSLEGNSGPYLQYAHARARSILAKSNGNGAVAGGTNLRDVTYGADERSLVRKIAEYNEVVAKATNELLPHYICTYLYELAQAFNRFYEHNRVIGDEREMIRLSLVEHYASTLRSGLELLGITAPERM